MKSYPKIFFFQSKHNHKKINIYQVDCVYSQDTPDDGDAVSKQQNIEKLLQHDLPCRFVKIIQ